MTNEKLAALRIDPEQKNRPRVPLFTIFLVILLATAAAIYFAIPRKNDNQRVFGGRGKVKDRQSETAKATTVSGVKSGAETVGSTNATDGSRTDVVLTVSGYIVARERI